MPDDVVVLDGVLHSRNVFSAEAVVCVATAGLAVEILLNDPGKLGPTKALLTATLSQLLCSLERCVEILIKHLHANLTGGSCEAQIQMRHVHQVHA